MRVKFNVLNYVLRVLTEFPSKNDSLAISGRTWGNNFSFLICKWKDTVEYLNELSYQKIMLHPKNLCFQPAIQWWDPVGMKAVSNHSLLSTFLFAIQIQVPNSMEGLSHETNISNLASFGK